MSFVRDVILRKQWISLTFRFFWTGCKKREVRMPPKFVYFSEEEAKGIEPDLMAMLDLARGKAGIPFTITCGLRDAQKNAEVGGVPDSAHLPDANCLSQAVDILCIDSIQRWKMVFSLKEAGFTRIIIEMAHIHVDIDGEKPQYVLGVMDKP
jgi:hypothetical protein